MTCPGGRVASSRLLEQPFENEEVFQAHRDGREAVVLTGGRIEVFIVVMAEPDREEWNLANFDEQDDAIAAAQLFVDTGEW